MANPFRSIRTRPPVSARAIADKSVEVVNDSINCAFAALNIAESIALEHEAEAELELIREKHEKLKAADRELDVWRAAVKEL